MAPFVVCTDARSALGSAVRSSLWKSARGACPSLAGVEQTVFGVGHTVMRAEVGNGKCEKIGTQRGAGQGGLGRSREPRAVSS